MNETLGVAQPFLGECINMKYLSVEEARKQSGLRLVLTAHMPGPWGEAAKAERAAAIDVARDPVAGGAGWVRSFAHSDRSDRARLDAGLLHRNLRTGWLWLVATPGIDGAEYHATNPPSSGTYDMTRMTRSYGVNPETIARAPKRMVSIMNGLATQLHRQKAAGSDYLVGKQVSACDLHWAALSLFVSPLPPEECAMPDFMRENYTHLTPELAAALDPSCSSIAI